MHAAQSALRSSVGLLPDSRVPCAFPPQISPACWSPNGRCTRLDAAQTGAAPQSGLRATPLSWCQCRCASHGSALQRTEQSGPRRGRATVFASKHSADRGASLQPEALKS